MKMCRNSMGYPRLHPFPKGTCRMTTQQDTIVIHWTIIRMFIVYMWYLHMGPSQKWPDQKGPKKVLFLVRKYKGHPTSFQNDHFWSFLVWLFLGRPHIVSCEQLQTSSHAEPIILNNFWFIPIFWTIPLKGKLIKNHQKTINNY